MHGPELTLGAHLLHPETLDDGEDESRLGLGNCVSVSYDASGLPNVLRPQRTGLP